MATSTNENPENAERPVNTSAGEDVTLRHHGRRTSDRQAAFLLPYLRPGMYLLDCGCGPGSITEGLARLLSPGSVVGIHSDPHQLERAQGRMANQDCSNLRFEFADLYELPFADNSFDAAFSHAVFMHLSDPMAALHEMYRVLKPGGVVGIRNADFTSYLISAADPAMENVWKLVGRLTEQRGGNAYMGRHLRGMLQRAGFVNVEESASYDSFGTEEAIRHWGNLMADFIRSEDNIREFVDYGIATREELEDLATAWQAWGERPDAFHASSFCEVIGWKA